MTTVLTRAYPDAASGKGIYQRLYRAGFPYHHLSLVTDRGKGKETILTDLQRALVPDDLASGYIDAIADGAAVVVVRATYKPLGAVRVAREAFETSGAMDLGLEVQEAKVRPPKDHAPSILKDHPRFLTMTPLGDHQTMSEKLGLRLLSEPKSRASAIPGGKLMLGGRVKSGRVATSAIKGGGYMSRAFWPMPLVSDKPRKLSVIKGGGHPFSRLLGWPTRT